jgi:hypothetical protein
MDGDKMGWDGIGWDGRRDVGPTILQKKERAKCEPSRSNPKNLQTLFIYNL